MTHTELQARLTNICGTDDERARAALAVLTPQTAAEFARTAAANMTNDQVTNGVCDAAERLLQPIHYYTPFHVEL